VQAARISPIVAGVVVAVAVFISYMLGLSVGRQQREQPVCHAVTEDSMPYDCDYHDGAWWRK
jgi:hypothetical protein